MVVGACIFHQALTALFAFICSFLDIFLFLVARQASRQGALWGKAVCWVLSPGGAVSPPEILGDSVTSNACVENPSAGGYRLFSFYLASCALQGYSGVPRSSGGHSHSPCPGGFQLGSCLDRTPLRPYFYICCIWIARRRNGLC